MSINMVLYNACFTFTEPVLGTTPMNQQIYKDYIESKRKEDAGDDESGTVENREERGWTGFHREPDEHHLDEHPATGARPIAKLGRLFVYDYTIRGFLKESGNALRQCGAHDVKAWKTKIDQFVFAHPRRIFFIDTNPHKHGLVAAGGCGHEPTPAVVLAQAGIGAEAARRPQEACWYVHAAHEVFERPLRADTPQGPRVALARSDLLRAGVRLPFVLKNIWPRVFTEDLLNLIFQRGELLGYGQFRTGSYGRFTYTLSRDGSTPRTTAEDPEEAPASSAKGRGGKRKAAAKDATVAASASDES